MLGSLALAVASGFLGGIVLLAAGLGMANARHHWALRVVGVVTLVTIFVFALISGIVFVWLALMASPTAGAFTLGAGLGAAVGVAVALVVGLSLVSLLLMRAPMRAPLRAPTRSAADDAARNGAAYGYAPLARRMTHW